MHKEITVSKEIFSKFKTISKALEAATDGTKIFIKPGTYRERIIIDKQVELIGSGPVDKIIVTSRRPSAVICVKTPKAIIRGITIHQRGILAMDDPAVDLPIGSTIIENCHIISDNGKAVFIHNLNTNPTIQRCSIYDSQYGIYVCDQATPTIRDCRIYRSKEFGIFVGQKGNGRVVDCEIYNNRRSNIYVEDEGRVEINGSKIYESKEKCGIFVTTRGSGTLVDCEIHGNTLSNIVIGEEGNGVVNRCKVYDSKTGCGIVLRKGHGTIMDCEIHSSKLANIWITKEGKGEVNRCKIHDNKEWGGIFINDRGEGTMIDCEIYNSKLANILIQEEGIGEVKGCKVYDGNEGGIAFFKKGRGMIKNSEIYGNTLSNIVIAGGKGEVKGCKIYDSNQAGIFVTLKGRGTIIDCEIHDNIANIYIEEGKAEIDNCKIYKSRYGVAAKKQSRVTIENCQIFGNQLQNIFASEDSYIQVTESINEQEHQREKRNSSSPMSVDLSEVLSELDSLIGLENVKNQIRQMVEYIQFNQQLSEFEIESNEKLAAAHTVLYGNPGTGKTTVAKLLGKFYKALGLLPSGHFVQANREKLVGEYIGHTAPKTKAKIEEAMGGVLFIDEAYELANKGTERDFGLEAIAVLLEEMENRRGEFVVIVAGYSQEMEQFLEANPGLKSRFTQYFHLEDYTPDELLAIVKKMVKDKKRKLSEDAEKLLHKELTMLWRKRDRFFGNARTVRNCVEAMMQAQAQRCMRVPKKQWTKEFLLTLNAEDVKAAFPKEETKVVDLPINEELLSQAMEQLNRMIGMKQVKEEIEKLVTLVRYYKESGKSLKELSPHTLLIGNPGTGKTEVARIIAKIYEALGILERGDLVEVNRDKLVSIYQGGSEKLIDQYLEQAMGGTLFIDEAYQLTQYGPDDPGHKAVEVLLKRMEDDRGKFIVLVAGYKEKMEQFLDSNEGLRRRFERRIEFADYTPTELLEISKLMLQEKGYWLHVQAEKELLAYYQMAYENRDHTFGNAGLARNIVNQAIRNLDYRMAKLPKEQRTLRQTKMILKRDLPI